MAFNLPVNAKEAARAIVQLKPEFVVTILKELQEVYSLEPLIGQTTDDTLKKVYRRDGKLEVIEDLKKLFFPNGL